MNLRQKKSFSLIEMVIAIATLVIIASFLVPILSKGIDSWLFAAGKEKSMVDISKAALRLSYEIRNTSELIIQQSNNIRFRSFPNSCREITYREAITAQGVSYIQRREQENCSITPGDPCYGTCNFVQPGGEDTQFLIPIKSGSLNFAYFQNPQNGQTARLRMRFIYIDEDGKEYPEQMSIVIFNRI